ncbi:substrate-binding domain-containing protein [Tamlana sp. 2201CG12-4]|uniref:substrate-binding domain-containing protein n=1 Tax=Tamlana sp. 2201CG12-4 TaxID=3112582 RepID=UPI002DB76267|nr:substrate-binding domain-containing protein [Tamlana sp. 2201CG12-4]MEC3905517.1 substrate-binding domain-containing protein [Tamlana sp. 2201CG12-4]
MATIKDIAKIAGVSEGTIDRVIHNRGGVSAKTEIKIKKILEEHNFTLNPIASALASNKKYKVSCLIPQYDEQNTFWKSPLLGILKAYDEFKTFGVQIKNYTFNQFDSSSYLKQFADLLNEKPHAVVLAPIFELETKQIVEQLDTLNIPYLFLNIDIDGLNNITFIGQDSYKGGYVSGKLMHLSLEEHDACAIVQTRLNITNYLAISKRIKGFKGYLKDHNIKLNVLNLSIDLLNPILAKEALNTFLENHSHIKGLFVPTSRSSVITDFINEDKLKPLHIIGFDTTKNNLKSLQEGKLKFLISQRAFNQGYDAIKTMSDFLIYKKVPSKKIYSPIQIIIKENIEFAIEESNKDLESAHSY